ADLYPHIEGGLSGGRSRFSESVESIRGRPTHATDFQASVAVPFYEIDLWGRLRRLTESAQAQLLASEEARKTVAISLISAVAQSYIELRDLDQQREISMRTLHSRQEFMKITRARYENGLSSVLDVHEAESSVARAEDTIADIERRIGQKENELSILLGRNPGAIPRGEALTIHRLPPDVPAGLPSSLIERRPDILQAEQNLIAANANIGAAKALMFPTISLTALFGYESSDLSNLFEGPSKIWTYAARATVPIFTAGKNRSRVEIAEAQQRSALLQYEQTVQRAFREVEDALIEYKKRREQYVAQEALVQAERKRLTLTELRYINGITPYVDVLNAQNDLFNAELSYSQTLRARLAAVIQLYRALGGGWEEATAS
ncbi:MAG TPA: efflux transporter outer membrane subunit, partial [Dissulfurispiraceae bacterium]|nr:efflux transporter outer membrane subunit [Dissulfurispiraceae bacterium]